VRALRPEATHLVVAPDPEDETGALERARAMAERLGGPTEEIDLDPHVDPFLDEAPEANPLRRYGFVARVRTALLLDRSAAHRALVLGAVSKTDRLLGLHRIHAEEVCAVDPIGDLYATEVRALAKPLGVADLAGPEPTIEVSDAGVDGGELEPNYAWIDPLLRLIHDGRLRRKALVDLGYERADVRRLVLAIRRTSYKRTPPVIPVLRERPV
jgi:NAD+ synthase